MSSKSVSIIIPVYNEEKNIEEAIRDTKDALRGIDDYELVVINDGSTDKTGEILELLAKKDKHMRLLVHKRNLGFGQTIKDGFAAARKEYVAQFHGDNDAAGSSLRRMLKEIGKVDLVISYTADSHTRSLPRRVVSKLFVITMNILFGMNLRYFNGCFLCRTKLLKSIKLTSTGFAIYAEAKVRLLKTDATYIEVPFEHVGRKHGESKAVSAKSVVETLHTMWILILDVYGPVGSKSAITTKEKRYQTNLPR